MIPIKKAMIWSVAAAALDESGRPRHVCRRFQGILECDSGRRKTRGPGRVPRGEDRRRALARGGQTGPPAR